jgi:glycosyltransferase involved in cell wall biosynthesis
MILLSHPTGNAFSRAILRGLLEADLLGQFVTSIAVNSCGGLIQCLPKSIRTECLRRHFEVPPSLVSAYPVKELCRLAAQRVGAGFLTRQETGLLSCDAIYRGIDRAVARHLPGWARRRRLTGVYCYEDGALETFRAARNLGLRTCYDLPIAYWETAGSLMREELERVPQWRPTMEAIRNSAAKLQRKTEELDLADTVLCPSRFVYDTLPSSARESKRCVMVPFGSPPLRIGAKRAPQSTTAPLRVLFAGSMTQRKGLADLFAAMKLLHRADVQLVVFGSPLAPMSFYRAQFSDFVYEAPRPNEQVLRLMETCDILVLPSLVEGRALVQQEALSCGLPLIITPNTGGQDLIEEGLTGFLVPIRSPEAIAEKIEWFADHRGELEAMRVHARRKAAELTWPDYARQTVAAIMNKSTV